MNSIIIPLYLDEYTEQIDLTLNYYNNLGVLHEVVVIDDCSSTDIPYNKFKNIIWARINDDIDWNQPGARNLGAYLSTGDKLVFVDIDHLLPTRIFVYEEGVTMFKRLYGGREIPPNQGIVGINKKDFQGYDEDFCGNYGKDDKFFLNSHGRIRTSDEYLVCLNSKTHRLVRDTTTNEELYKSKLALLLAGKYTPPPRLRFKWEKING